MIRETNYYHGGGTKVVANNTSVGSCCGSRYLSKESPARKWKNQYGEGVSKAVARDPIRDNHKGILVIPGVVGEEGTFDSVDVKHLKTKNGTLTVSIRKSW